MRNLSPKKPDNVERFLKEARARLPELDANGWSVELTELYDLSVTHNLGLHTPDPRTHAYADASGTNQSDEVHTIQLSVPTVQFVDAGDDDVRLLPQQRPAWIIDAKAPDAVILEQVKHALEERRKSSPPPVAKRGGHAPNNSIDAATFYKWRSSKIVELGRLLAWRATLDPREARQYPDHVIGEWLGFSGKNVAGMVAKRTNAAKKTLKQAIASRPALLAQITQQAELSMTPDEAMTFFLKNMKVGRDADGNPEILVPRQMTIAKSIDTRKRRP
jgi:hypothetical protein